MSLEVRLKKLEQTKPKDNRLDNELSMLPFWCDDIESIDCCFTHKIGLPQHPATLEPLPLTPFQNEFSQAVIHGRDDYGTEEEKMRKSLCLHVNKGRQMGFTEIVLRLIQYLCFHRYRGSKIAIIAGNDGALAKKDLLRFFKLFDKIPSMLTDQELKGNNIHLTNGSGVFAFKASINGIRGDTKYKCILLDEAAKWRFVDDSEAYDTILPLVNTNGSDLFLVSTPSGMGDMFYKIHKDPKNFIKFEYNIWRTEGNLYTREQIEDILANSQEDVNQEFLCKFTISENALFGEVTEEDMKGRDEFKIEGLD